MKTLSTLIGFLLLSLTPSLATADVLDCDQIPDEPSYDHSKSTVPHLFGKDKIIVVERCEQFAGHAYYDTRVNISIWKDGERLFHQKLGAGIITDTGMRVEIDRDKQTVNMSVGCGDVYEEGGEKNCDARWSWSESHQVMLRDALPGGEEHAYYSGISAQTMRDFDEALKKDDIEAARQHLLSFAKTLEYEQNARWFAAQHLRFLEVVRKKALEAHKAKKTEEAIALARLLFDNSAHSLGVILEDDYGKIIKLGYRNKLVPLAVGPARRVYAKPDDPRHVRVVLLPDNDRTTLILNDLLFFLAKSEEIEDLRRALEPMHDLSRRVPDRMVLHLNIGDACWEYLHHAMLAGERENSVETKALNWMIYHYKQYLTKPTSNVAAKRATKRVNQAIEEIEQEKTKTREKTRAKEEAPEAPKE